MESDSLSGVGFFGPASNGDDNDNRIHLVFQGIIHYGIGWSVNGSRPGCYLVFGWTALYVSVFG